MRHPRQPARRGLSRPLVASSALLLLASCRFGAPPGDTTQGQEISNLYHLMFYIAIGVAAVVYLLILWSVVRYRKRKNDDELPPQFRKHIPLEVLYTVVPVAIVLFLFVVTFGRERSVDRLSAHPDLVVKAVAFQWQWRFVYPEQGIDVLGTPSREPTLVLPVGKTIQINLDSADVIHAFFVPDFLFKRDVLPDQENRFDITIPRAGTFRGECAEYCGLDHAEMNFVIKAVSPSQFAAWVASHGSSGGAA